jgi:hypothetical protein
MKGLKGVANLKFDQNEMQSLMKQNENINVDALKLANKS